MSPSSLRKHFCHRLVCAFLYGMLTMSSVSAEPAARASCIVQAESLQLARNAVIRAGGAIANDLKAMGAVNAFLTVEQRAQLESMPGVTILDNEQAHAFAVNPPNQAGSNIAY